MIKPAIIKLAILSFAIGLIAYIFNTSFIIAAIIIACVGVLGSVIHLPENMPGAADNPDGKGIHPKNAIIIGASIVMMLITLGAAFPNIYSFGW